MGSILSSKVKEDGKIIFEVILDYEEALQMKGVMDYVHLFSENNETIPSNLSERGKNSATKYFLIPKQLRKNLKFNSNVTVQKVDTKSKIFFIYSIDKFYNEKN